MLKKVFTYGFVEGIAKGLNKLTLLLLPFFLNTEDFGLVGLIISVELILPFLTFLGFEKVILRFYHEVDTFFNFKKTIFSSILVLHIFLVFIFSILYLCGIKQFLGLTIPIWLLLIVIVYLQGRNQLILNMYRVDEQHKLFFKSRLLFQIFKFLLIIVLVYLLNSYMGYLYAALISGIFINFRYNLKLSKEKFNSDTFSKLLLFSWPFIFHGIATNLLGNADRFILKKFMGLDDVGLYTFAYSIGSMVVFAYVGLSVYMEPLMYKSKNIKIFNTYVEKYNLYAIALGLIVLLCLNLVVDFVFPIYYSKYQLAFKYIPFIGLAHILFPFYLTSNYRLVYQERTKIIALLSIIASLVNIILNFILIPLYGLLAAVFSTMISYALQALVFSLVSNKILRKELLLIIIYSLVILLGATTSLNHYIILLLMGIVCFINLLIFSKNHA